MWSVLNFYKRFSMGCILMWPTFVLVMRISIGSKKLTVAKVLGLCSEPWNFDSTINLKRPG